MGGKTSRSTQQITIPPEVLARYNAINARSDTVTNKPYQYYQGQFVAPLTGTQQAGIANTNAAAGMAQPYFGAATGQLMGAQQAAMPYYQGATQQLSQGINAGNQLAAQSYNTLGTAQEQAAGIQGTALNNLNAAYAGAQPYNQAAGNLYQEGLQQGRDFTGQSAFGTQQALAGAQPFQQAATQYMGSGAQAVNPTDLGANEINKYMSPYLSTVLQGTAGLLNQQNQQQQSGQMGNAIRSGAFGGDRSGIAAANLNQQQNLANSKIFSDLLNQGFGQALGTAQQQQQLGLGAAQANRAAQQQAAQQALAIGQQGFGQGLSAAQQQAALGQQLFGMGSTTGQNAAALGQQVYGQGTGTAAQQAAMAQQIFGQGATAAQQQAALGQQQFGQGTAASQQAAALGQGLYGLGANTASQLAALGTGAQGAALSGAGAQMAAGQAEQATQQAENTAKYNEFLQAQSLPYQQLKLASDIALGTGTASGSTTTTAQPGGFFSDERLKENIKAVGKTFDGQTIHSYNYKGDPRTQIGLIAQEVQKHHPEAVGLAGGYKTVNYDKATEDAADRGHMASGGLASAGGSVMPQDAGQGFADGGLAGFDPSVMQQMLAAQQAMYAPLSSGNMYAGGPNAGGGLVPQSSVAASQLMTPSALPQQATGAEKAKTIVDLGNSINKFGEGIGAWGDDDTPDDGFRLSRDTLKEINASSKSERHRAMGGGIPYGGQGLDIPTDGLAAGSNGPMTAGNLPGQQSGLDKLSKVANVADTGMKLGKFGQKIGLFSTGGTPYGGHGLDIPEGDDLDDSRQPMTAASLEKPESGLDKVGKIAQIAGTVAAMFGSDKRMKENIKPIGKLFDGQIVHSYNYKGDPRTQIGLIAQEVEGHKPHAVGKIHGMKAVDYAKATSGAAKRGHFAEGGMPKVPVNSILASLRKEIDPRSNLSELASEQDMELDRNLRPDSMSEQRLGGLRPTPAAILPKSMETPSAGVAGAGTKGMPDLPKTGLAPKIGALPTGIMQIARLIHAGEGTGKNPSSSAKGPYQFVDGTFVDQFRKNYPDRAKGMSKSQIISLKHGPEGAKISSEMGPRFIADNAKIIQRGGHTPDAGNVYLAHFLGADTAVKVLNADPSAPISRYVSQDAIDANPPLQKNPTVGGTINWARGYMAQQEKNLSRKGRSSGGLAGREGYLVGGDVALTPEQIAEQARREEVQRELMKELPIQTIGETPGTSAVNRFPAAEPVKAEGLGAGSPEDMARAVASAEPVKAEGLGAGSPEDMARAVAGAQAQPEKRAGLAKRVFGYDKSKPYDPKTNNKFLQRLGHGETDAVLTALQGLAAMGTAPTRSLGVALATGLGTGAQAYQAQREFGRQLRETAALETNVQAAKLRADADIATARFNTNTLPGKIAGWRQMAAKMAAKNDPNAAFATQTANTLQGILDAVEKDLGGLPRKSADQLVPSDAPAAGAAQTPPAAGAVQTPPAADVKKQRTFGDVVDDLNFQAMAGLPTLAIEKELEKAGVGMRIGPDGNFEIDPSYVKTKIGVDTPIQRQSEAVTADTEIGKTTYNNAIQDNVTYQKAWPIIRDLKPLGDGQEPTTGLISALTNAIGSAFGYSEDKMAEVFGPQPNTNSILNAARAEGIPVDPSLGIAGLNKVISALREKVAAADVRARAAKEYVAVNGYGPGMQAHIDKTLRAHGLIP
jgi:hypothetical protein